MTLGLDRLGLESAGLHPGQAHFDADAIQPRRNRRLAAKVLETAVRAQEHVLREIARVLVVGDEAIAQLVDRTAVPLDDQIEGACPAVETRGDELDFAELREPGGRRFTGGLRLWPHYREVPGWFRGSWYRRPRNRPIHAGVHLPRSRPPTGFNRLDRAASPSVTSAR